jgi:HD-GYP domain-containing protein (c-di-GMP phosphodiesterase class II)
VRAFEAITVDRPYRRGRSKAETIRELRRCSGTQFEPDVVAPLVELLSVPVLATA